MKHKRVSIRPVDIKSLIDHVATCLEETTLFTGIRYEITFINYTRNLKVTDKNNNRTLYHSIKSVQDASECLAFYDGYSQAIYDTYNVIEKELDTLQSAL